MVFLPISSISRLYRDIFLKSIHRAIINAQFSCTCRLRLRHQNQHINNPSCCRGAKREGEAGGGGGGGGGGGILFFLSVLPNWCKEVSSYLSPSDSASMHQKRNDGDTYLNVWINTFFVA